MGSDDVILDCFGGEDLAGRRSVGVGQVADQAQGHAGAKERPSLGGREGRNHIDVIRQPSTRTLASALDSISQQSIADAGPSDLIGSGQQAAACLTGLV